MEANKLLPPLCPMSFSKSPGALESATAHPTRIARPQAIATTSATLESSLILYRPAYRRTSATAVKSSPLRGLREFRKS
jgi:hypothetical protein